VDVKITVNAEHGNGRVKNDASCFRVEADSSRLKAISIRKEQWSTFFLEYWLLVILAYFKIWMVLF